MMAHQISDRRTQHDPTNNIYGCLLRAYLNVSYPQAVVFLCTKLYRNYRITELRCITISLHLIKIEICIQYLYYIKYNLSYFLFYINKPFINLNFVFNASIHINKTFMNPSLVLYQCHALAPFHE
uniref:Uncharacterized protein n=1 Tax=Arundo donax TaxID=35708 RepID=A0A0A9GRR0_ARUDO